MAVYVQVDQDFQDAANMLILKLSILQPGAFGYVLTLYHNDC